MHLQNNNFLVISTEVPISETQKMQFIENNLKTEDETFRMEINNSDHFL